VVLTGHYLHVAQRDEDLAHVEWDFASDGLHVEPGHVRELNQIVETKAEAHDEHEDDEADGDVDLHSMVHSNEVSFEEKHECDEKRCESQPNNTVGCGHDSFYNSVKVEKRGGLEPLILSYLLKEDKLPMLLVL